MIDRRQFLRGVLATGVAAVGVAATAAAATASAPTGTGRTLGSAESFLLGTGRRALG